MSVKTYTDTTRIIKTIEEHVWEIHCDAIGCNASLEFRENRDTGDITADGDYTGPDMDTEWLDVHDTNTAIQTALQHATQTHLLEKKVDALGWMAANGPQTLNSMTRAQAHLMLAERDLLDAIENNEKEENDNE